MRARRATGVAVFVLGLVLVPAAAPAAAPACKRAVVFTLPGVRWADVERWRPPHLLDAVNRGAVASMSVRTISARTSYPSAYATIGAGSRVDAGFVSSGPAEATPGGSLLERNLVVAGLDELTARARAAGYNARPGALGSAAQGVGLVAVGNADPGKPPPSPAGPGRWVLYAAMNTSGVVGLSATSPALLRVDRAAPFDVRADPVTQRRAVDRALSAGCSSVVIEPGDLARADRYGVTLGTPPRREVRVALRGADALLGYVMRALEPDRDLLLVLSPTSPAWADQVHLGVAVAVGPGFSPGDTLESASTRRPGVVTLPDVAPTLLDHIGLRRPASMNGRPWVAQPSPWGDRIAAAVDLDREARFVGRLQRTISTVFVIAQLLVYLSIIALLAWRERTGRAAGPGRLTSALELLALGVVAFFPATYLMGIPTAHSLGAVGFCALLIALDALLVGAVAWALPRRLDGLLALSALTTGVLCVDLLLGAPLEYNTVFGYSPIIAGRFAGIGNTGFAVLGASALVTGALIVHRWNGSGPASAACAALFVAVVVFDGAPQLGSDVGGVIALVPGFAITWLLLAGKRPSPRLIVLSLLGAALLLGAFLILDLTRPPSAQTHLARLFEDVRQRGGGVLVDTIERKARANLEVFRTTIWTYLVPPSLVVLGWLVARPRGRWGRIASRYPRLRAGLVGGLVLALLGFALNDSGIVIPALVLSFLVPLALIVHLMLDRDEETARSRLPMTAEDGIPEAGAAHGGERAAAGTVGSAGVTRRAAREEG